MFGIARRNVLNNHYCAIKPGRVRIRLVERKGNPNHIQSRRQKWKGRWVGGRVGVCACVRACVRMLTTGQGGQGPISRGRDGVLCDFGKSTTQKKTQSDLIFVVVSSSPIALANHRRPRCGLADHEPRPDRSDYHSGRCRLRP